MALIECPDCGRPCSTLANQCPQCGRPFNSLGFKLDHSPLDSPPLPPPPSQVDLVAAPAPSAKNIERLGPRASHPKKILLTDQERKDQNIGAATLAGCVIPLLVLLAALFALIPFIGWIISIGLLLFAFGAAANMFAFVFGVSKTSEPGDYWLEGECPYCSHAIKVLRKNGKEADTSFQQCTTCKERVLVKDDTFYTILKTYSDAVQS